MSSMTKPSTTLRQLILKSPKSQYAIAHASGVDAAVLNRFIKHGRGLSLETVDALSEYFGVALRPIRSKK